MRDNRLGSGKKAEPERLCFQFFMEGRYKTVRFWIAVYQCIKILPVKLKRILFKIPEKSFSFFKIVKKYHEKELKLMDFYDKVNKNIYYLKRTSEFF